MNGEWFQPDREDPHFNDSDAIIKTDSFMNHKDFDVWKSAMHLAEPIYVETARVGYAMLEMNPWFN